MIIGLLSERLLAHRPPPLPRLRRASKVAEQSRRILARWNEAPTATLTLFELRQTLDHIRKAWKEQGSIEGLELRDRRWIPWVLCFPEVRPSEWLAHDAKFLSAYFSWLGDRAQPSRVLMLLKVFLLRYPDGLRTFHPWREGLAKLLNAGNSARLSTWRTRCREFGFLSKDAPAQFWRSLIEAEDLPKLLSRAGFEGELRQSRFLELAIGNAIAFAGQHLERELSAKPLLKRLRDLITIDERLAYPQLVSQLATSLLVPFRDRTPRPELQEDLIGFFHATLGDPRILPASGWSSAPRVAMEIVLRWLVRATLEDFLRLIRSTALHEHWKYRERFWRAFLASGAITDAWIVLGSNARARAGPLFRQGMGGAGRLRGQAMADQSVLLLRLGQLVVAEWSHDGACRVWSVNRKGCPRLYETEYSGDGLRRAADKTLRHDGSDRGRWQDELASHISSYTGIKVSRKEYFR